MLSSKPENVKFIKHMKFTLIFQINGNKSGVLSLRVNSTSYSSPVLEFSKGFPVATKKRALQTFNLIVQSHSGISNSFSFRTIQHPAFDRETHHMENRLKWEKLTSGITQEMQTHTYSNQHQLFSLHTHIKKTYLQL